MTGGGEGRGGNRDVSLSTHPQLSILEFLILMTLMELLTFLPKFCLERKRKSTHIPLLILFPLCPPLPHPSLPPSPPLPCELSQNTGTGVLLLLLRCCDSLFVFGIYLFTQQPSLTSPLFLLPLLHSSSHPPHRTSPLFSSLLSSNPPNYATQTDHSTNSLALS
jgi:hypothetical protein